MDSSVERPIAADEDVGACEGGGGNPLSVLPQSGSGGGSFDEGGALAGAASLEASAEAGVPNEVRVFRRCEAGTISPVPIKVANGDLSAMFRCEAGAGIADNGAGVIERGAGVTERGAGVANGNPLREDGGALMLIVATGRLTLGKVELRLGTGRF